MDYMTSLKIVVLILIYGLVYLDRVVAFQLMLHRPFVISIIVGLLVGNLAECVQVGILLEILWVSRLPVGASVLPDDSAAALFGAVAISYLASVKSVGVPEIALVTSVATLVGEVGKEADIALRRMNGKISHYAVSAVNVGDLRTVESCVYASLILWFISGVILALFWAVLGILFGTFFVPALGGDFVSPFSVMIVIIPATGAVSLYQRLKMVKKGTIFHMALASGALVFLILEWGIIG